VGGTIGYTGGMGVEGAATGITVSSGGTLWLEPGGAASGITVGSGGSAVLLSGSATTGITVQSGGEILFEGGAASGVTLDPGATAFYSTVSSGQTVSGGLVGFFQSQTVLSGGTVVETNVSGGMQSVYGAASGIIVSGVLSFSVRPELFEGNQYVFSGGRTVGTVAGPFGEEIVSSGGVAVGTTLSGGALVVSSGGVASGTIVMAEGSYFGSTGSSPAEATGGEFVLAGGQEIGGTVGNGGGAYVFGAVTGVAVGSGGSLAVDSGGTATAVTVGSGGSLDLKSGGTASGVTVQSGGEVLFEGGSVNGLTLESGATVFYAVVSSGQTVSGEIVGPGLRQAVLSGGKVVDPVVSRGEQDVSGEVSGAVIVGENPGLTGDQYVNAGGTISGTRIGDWGRVEIDSGGKAQATLVSGTGQGSGGFLIVRSGGVASGTTIVGLGPRNSGFDTGEFIAFGGVEIGATVKSGGYLEVESRGIVSGATISSGGDLQVDYEGTVSGARVAGGEMIVLGGSATGIGVSSGGFVFAGSLYGVLALAGGAVTRSIFHSGSVLAVGVYGSVSGAVISAGATLLELAGQTSSVVLNGGTQFVGGTLPGVPAPDPPRTPLASGTIVSSGGVQYLNSHGNAAGTVVMSGGEIVFNGGADTGLSVSSGGMIDLAALAFSSAASVQFVENAQNTSGVLRVGNGADSIAVTLLGQYVAAGFHLAGDGGGGSLVTYSPPVSAHLELAANH